MAETVNGFAPALIYPKGDKRLPLTGGHLRPLLLTFLLPDGARHDLAGATPDLLGCLFEILLGFVCIYGRSREAVFAQAEHILVRACPAGSRYSIAAGLHVNQHQELDPRRDWLPIGGGLDHWTIIFMGGQAAFAPTSLGAEFAIDPAAIAGAGNKAQQSA
jgi:hypothetical protein